MIKRSQIIDVVCPYCESDEIVYSNDKLAAYTIEEENRARARGWFCGGCRRPFLVAKRGIFSRVVRRKAYGKLDYKKQIRT